jgi:hypothetical protein
MTMPIKMWAGSWLAPWWPQSVGGARSAGRMRGREQGVRRPADLWAGLGGGCGTVSVSAGVRARTRVLGVGRPLARRLARHRPPRAPLGSVHRSGDAWVMRQGPAALARSHGREDAAGPAAPRRPPSGRQAPTERGGVEGGRGPRRPPPKGPAARAPSCSRVPHIMRRGAVRRGECVQPGPALSVLCGGSRGGRWRAPAAAKRQGGGCRGRGSWGTDHRRAPGAGWVASGSGGWVKGRRAGGRAGGLAMAPR